MAPGEMHSMSLSEIDDSPMTARNEHAVRVLYWCGMALLVMLGAFALVIAALYVAAAFYVWAVSSTLAILMLCIPPFALAVAATTAMVFGARQYVRSAYGLIHPAESA